MGIFKAYDIRGVYPDEINEEMAFKIGQAFVTLFKPKKILVGKDMRTSSPSLYDALARGITQCGCDIVFAGMCDTPMFYFCAREYEAAIMVTASHNPGKYNGFKFCGANVNPITYDAGLCKIEEFIAKAKPVATVSEDKFGKITEKDFMKDFVEFHLNIAKKIGKYNGRKLKIVCDAGNGMGGLTFPKVFEKLDHEFHCIYPEPDGNFPNHEANPMKAENLIDLQKEVLKQKADFGIALDGDADRCMFVDEKAQIVSADLITALAALEILKEHPKSTILYDLRGSKIMKEVIENANGKALMCRVGHSYIKEQMRKENAIFAGELSAHFYFKDNCFAESSLMTTFEIMKILTESGKPFSELILPLRKYSHSGEINFEVKDKEAKMKELEKIFHNGKITHLDGVRIDFDDWWFNVRASNTEPVLRLNLEASTEKKMIEMKDKISKIIMN